MEAKLKAKIKGRVLTLISKIEELQKIGYETDEANNLMPDLEGFKQSFFSVYCELNE